MDDYIALTNSIGLYPQQFTISVWINLAEDQSSYLQPENRDSIVFTNYAYSSESQLGGFIFYISDDGQASIRIYGNGINKNDDYKGTASIPLNIWIYVVATYDGHSNLKVFINDGLDTTKISSFPCIPHVVEYIKENLELPNLSFLIKRAYGFLKRLLMKYIFTTGF